MTTYKLTCTPTEIMDWSQILFQHLGMSENGVYPQWNSHLVGIMISKTIGCRGTQHFQTNPFVGVVKFKSCKLKISQWKTSVYLQMSSHFWSLFWGCHAAEVWYLCMNITTKLIMLMLFGGIRSSVLPRKKGEVTCRGCPGIFTVFFFMVFFGDQPLGIVVIFRSCVKNKWPIIGGTLWLFNSPPWYRWPIEIDGLPL